MLVRLQPGHLPLGQFDLEDDDVARMVGGEVGFFRAITTSTDGYAPDVAAVGPMVQVKLGSVDSTVVPLHGLVDGGIAGYGTPFGSIIGGSVGQGTGVGTLSTQGVVVVGPSTAFGSGKATLWTTPGLYGVTSDAWAVGSEFTGVGVNARLYGKVAADAATDGKLTTTSTNNGLQVAVSLGLSNDTSLVSTTTVAHGGAAVPEFATVYLLGAQKA